MWARCGPHVWGLNAFPCVWSNWHTAILPQRITMRGTIAVLLVHVCRRCGEVLSQSNSFVQDLKPACVTGDSTYGDRKNARTQEITALKEVQGILQSAFMGTAPAPAPVFLQVRRHGLQDA
eukprot:6483328-Amphidinium_carterae.1